ncbi:hypothetical protein K438DRAFT_240627 [Mycena galopus ATCC 62051]|nr:hypothetical protein K438DRAFT_240627 [Mycena galopus ATCC 62051]
MYLGGADFSRPFRSYNDITRCHGPVLLNLEFPVRDRVVHRTLYSPSVSWLCVVLPSVDRTRRAFELPRDTVRMLHDASFSGHDNRHHNSYTFTWQAPHSHSSPFGSAPQSPFTPLYDDVHVPPALAYREPQCR